MKFLYLADKAHLNKYGRPITFERYCALPYGPVASTALDLLKGEKEPLQKIGISELPFETQQLDKIVYIRTPKRSVNYNVFSKSDIATFDSVLSEYGDKTFGELFAITHEHFAYNNAWNSRGSKKSIPISYEDMIDEGASKASRVEQLEEVGHRMQMKTGDIFV